MCDVEVQNAAKQANVLLPVTPLFLSRQAGGVATYVHIEARPPGKNAAPFRWQSVAEGSFSGVQSHGIPIIANIATCYTCYTCGRAGWSLLNRVEIAYRTTEWSSFLITIKSKTVYSNTLIGRWG